MTASLILSDARLDEFRGVTPGLTLRLAVRGVAAARLPMLTYNKPNLT